MSFPSLLWVALYVDALTRVCVLIVGRQRAIFICWGGSVVGKVLCDEGSRLRKGLWQRLKDRKERQAESKQLAFQTLTSWNSHLFLSSLSRSPSNSVQHVIHSNLRWFPGALLWNRSMNAEHSLTAKCQSTWNGGEKDVHLFYKQQGWGIKVHMVGLLSKRWKECWWAYVVEGQWG